MTKECFFCQVQSNKQRVLFENDLLFLVLDNFPVPPGRGLLVPKRHVANLGNLSEDEWQSYCSSIRMSI